MAIKPWKNIEGDKKMKLYMVKLYKNGKEITRATGPKLDVLKKWAIDCQKEDGSITYELFEEV